MEKVSLMFRLPYVHFFALWRFINVSFNAKNLSDPGFINVSLSFYVFILLTHRTLCILTLILLECILMCKPLVLFCPYGYSLQPSLREKLIFVLFCCCFIYLFVFLWQINSQQLECQTFFRAAFRLCISFMIPIIHFYLLGSIPL